MKAIDARGIILGKGAGNRYEQRMVAKFRNKRCSETRSVWVKVTKGKVFKVEVAVDVLVKTVLKWIGTWGFNGNDSRGCGALSERERILWQLNKLGQGKIMPTCAVKQIGTRSILKFKDRKV